MPELVEEITLENTTVQADCCLVATYKYLVRRDGEPFYSRYVAKIYAPGDDVKSAEPSLCAMAKALHTPEVVATFKAAQAEAAAEQDVKEVA